MLFRLRQEQMMATLIGITGAVVIAFLLGRRSRDDAYMAGYIQGRRLAIWRPMTRIVGRRN